MGKEKEKLDRLRAKRGGHRTGVAKNINEARTILEHTDLEDIMWIPLKVVEQILDERLTLLAGFDEEIAKICSIDHIGKEIEAADEIRSRILATNNPNQAPMHYKITNMPHQKIQVKFIRVNPDHHRVLHFKLIS